MGLLQDIQNATIDADRPLAAVLRMAKVLAARLDNHLLLEWVDHELNGYPDDAILPPYRADRLVHVLGNFSGPFGAHFTNQPIPPLAIPEKHRDSYLFRFRFVEPVAAYEEMLRTREGDLQAPWPADALIVLRPRVFQGMECVRAWRVIPRGDFVGVLDGVRNRLLDLVLQLEREVPEAGDVPAAKLPVSSEQVTQIVTNTIYEKATIVTDNSVHVQGTAGNITGGEGNRARQGDVAITQHGSDLGVLIKVLRAAVEQMDGQLPAEQLDAAQALVEDLEEAAIAPQPARQRMLRTLKGITAIAGAAAGAGAAVIDAAQAIHRAIAS